MKNSKNFKGITLPCLVLSLIELVFVFFVGLMVATGDCYGYNAIILIIFFGSVAICEVCKSGFIGTKGEE